MLKSSDLRMKHVFFILSSITSFLILILYLIKLSSAGESNFNLFDTLRSFSISYLFLLILAVIDYKLVLSINKSSFASSHLWIRIIVEILALISIAIAFVILGNIPFYDGIQAFIKSDAYKQSIIAAILINIFTIITMEYFVQIRKNQRLAHENLRIQYKELKNQINPHFLFNSLNILVSLINKDSNEAVKYTKKLSDVYRYVLSIDVENLIELKEEFKFISTYIEILQIRFGKGLNVVFSIEEQMMTKKIIPMSLQVLIENAVKHNALSPSKPLKIKLSNDGDSLIVSNNLIARKSVDHSTGIGLKNLDKKYMLVTGKHINVIKDQDYFVVKLPLL